MENSRKEGPDGRNMCEATELSRQENLKPLKSGIEGVVYGYVFLLLDFNLLRLNIFPDWVAYLLFRESFDELGNYEPDVLLLKPLAALLAVYDAVYWVAALFGFEFRVVFAEVVVLVVGLYFHYQFMTDLGSLAVRYGSPRGAWFYWLRVLQAAITTFLAVLRMLLIGNEDSWPTWFGGLLFAASAVLVICTVLAVHALSETIKIQAQEVQT